MSSYPIQDIEFQKNYEKSQKIKKHYYGFFSSQNKLGKAEKERKKKNKKKIVPMSSYPTRNRKFQKNSKKNQKIKNHHSAIFFQAKIGGKRHRKRENKNYRSVSFLPDSN